MSSVEEKISFFESTLLDFFQKAGREHLPWRKDGVSAYEVWVSEIMLQQTQVSRVVSYYEKFLERFPDVETLARASWEEFLPYYEGLGYYARGRNMLRTAQVIVEKFGGEFPRDIQRLETLPGIGGYTAAAIASFAFGENVLAWDTNLKRVVGRFFFGSREGDWFLEMNKEESKVESRKSKVPIKIQNLQETESMTETGRPLEFSLPARVLNAAMMDFGSAICTGKPKCAACPLAARCRYLREEGEGEQELKIKNEKLKMRDRESGSKKERRLNNEELGAIVFLHENHRKYFSSVRNSYRPFVLPAPESSRARIKAWFRERYRLLVSVRPPHGAVALGKGKGESLLVNAQVLSGMHSFAEFSREETLRSEIFRRLENEKKKPSKKEKRKPC